MGRGARREAIFRDEGDCVLFLDCVAATVTRFALAVHAFALMPNHYHLLVRSVRGNLSRSMQNLLSSFVLGLNRRHKWDGPVFRGRFRNQRVDESDHLKTLLPYIHLNPVRAGLVPTPERALWSSCQAYVGLATRPDWLSCDLLLSLYGGVGNLVAHTRCLREGSMQWPSDFDLDRGVFKGWDGVPLDYDGKRRLRQANLDQVRARIMGIAQADWENICQRRMGPGGNPMLRFAVWALREGTDLRQWEIARLVGCKASHVAVLLNRLGHKGDTPKVRGWMSEFRQQEAAE